MLALDDRAIRVIAQICRGLDGLPLAIELAASRVKALSPAVLASQLGNRLRVLVGGPRDAPARQQTLRATIAWSYDILAPWERQLFRQLAIFSGGFSLSLVEQFQAVAGVAPGLVEEPLDTIAALVDHSLIHAVDDSAEDPRWQMLETIREFGVEQVVAGGLEPTYRRVHAEVMAGIADQVEDAMYGARQSAWIDRLAADANNFRAAINWAVANGEKEIALRIAGPLWRFWSYRHLGNEGRATLARVLAMPGEVSLPVLGEALRGAGCLHEDISDHVNSERYHRRALEVWTQVGDTRKIARSTDDLGNVAHEQGDFDLAERLHLEALRIAREHGHARVVASSLANLGSTAYLRGDIAGARDRWMEVVAGNAVDDPVSRTVVMNNLGVAHLQLGELDQAAKHLQAALAIHRELGMPPNAADVLINLSDVASREGDLAQAKVYFEAAKEIYHRLDDPKGLHNIYFSIGAEEHLNQGNPRTALEAFRTCLVYADRANNRLGFADGIERIVAIASETPKAAEAAVLLGAARSIRETIGAQPLPAQRRLNEETDTRLRRTLGEIGYAKALAAGGTLPPRQAAQKAMQLASELARTDMTSRRARPVAARPAPSPSDETPFRLTKREVEVLRLLSEGKTDRDIAAALFISPRTAGTHVTNILGKLDVETRAAAVAAAFRHGLL
jgi:DNA-binding NarL/FixJ family response regulator/Tfp pilus assembly protein PilF